ncbi:hypothetical protein [Streptomyces chartreusis]|uniref:hypothetical protein n=1 Tax=Streptomyces chartreusis TaxID=1969 RepID=UPI0033AD693B
MVKNRARKNDAKQRRAATGENHRQAVNAVRRAQPVRRLVSPGDRPPRDRAGFLNLPIRRGDVLRIRSTAGYQRISSIVDGVATLPWPWQPGIQSPVTVALPIGRGDSATRRPTLYRFTPDPATTTVKTHDSIRVDIPPTVVHVCFTTEEWLASDQDAGRRPADRDASITVLPHGVTESFLTHAQGNDPRIQLRPWAGDPITIDLIFRPYSTLEDFDEVTDADGRTWTYALPLDWRQTAPEDEARYPSTLSPRWPLTLTARHGLPPTPDEARAVAEATATGSHEDELQRWRAASGAEPADYAWGEPVPVLSQGQRRGVADRVRRRVHGWSPEKIREAHSEAVHWHHMVSKQVDSEDDLVREETARVKLTVLNDVLETLRLTGAESYEGEQTEFLRKIVEAAIYPRRPGPPRILHASVDGTLPCPCPRQACGAVGTDLALPECPQHGSDAPPVNNWHADDHCSSPDSALVILDVRGKSRTEQRHAITRVESLRPSHLHLLETAGERCIYDDPECQSRLDEVNEQRT